MPLSFTLRFALITAPTHYGQTHTNAQMSPAGCTRQKTSDEIRNDEKLRAQTKEKFPRWYGSFLGSVRSEVMKHLRRRNVRPNQRSRGRQRSARIIKLTSVTRSGPRVCEEAKYSRATWLISITSLPAILTDDRLRHVCPASSLAGWNTFWRFGETATPHKESKVLPGADMKPTPPPTQSGSTWQVRQ